MNTVQQAANQMLREIYREITTQDVKYFIQMCRIHGVIYSEASEDYYLRKCRLIRAETGDDAQDAREQAFDLTKEKYRR